MARVNSKVAIVTGAARGLGASIAQTLVNEGASVVLTDRLHNEGKAMARRLGKKAHFIQHDVTDEEAWKNVIIDTQKKFGEIDVLVNNAGIHGTPSPIDNMDAQLFRQVMDVNVLSVFLGMKTVVESMKKTGSGSIINISSLAGLIGTAGNGAYAASKFAVRGITKVAAVDYSPYKIRVNSVHPGLIQTDMTSALIPDDIKQLDDFSNKVALLGRVGVPEDVANLVLFLASEESSYSTGSEFVVDGGYCG